VAAPLSRRSRQAQRTIEGYLATGGPPRWMERFMQVENGIARERRRLAKRYEELRERYEGDPERFAARWREIAYELAFDDLNAVIRAHNTYYPIERDLPMNPRTGDYVTFDGRSYRRPELGPEWILAQFPAAPG
jgi:hypothetical protein